MSSSPSSSSSTTASSTSTSSSSSWWDGLTSGSIASLLALPASALAIYGLYKCFTKKSSCCSSSASACCSHAHNDCKECGCTGAGSKTNTAALIESLGAVGAPAQPADFSCTKSVSQVSDLAVIGKSGPLFKQLLLVGRPNVGDRDMFELLVSKIWNTRYFTNQGPMVQQLESELTQYLNVKHCIVFVNGTIGFELLLSRLPEGSEVIVPSFTYVATVHAVLRNHLVPVFCDIHPDTLCLDPEAAEKLVTDKTSAIIGVHLYGTVCDTDAIKQVAEKKRAGRTTPIRVFYDAAHAFGCTRKGVKVGNFGEAEMFSFHATKFFHSVEGGCVTTNDDELAAQLKAVRNFGFAGYNNLGEPVVTAWGSNGKMSEVCGAMGLVNMRQLDSLFAINSENLAAYRSNLQGIPGIRLLDLRQGGSVQSNCQYVVVQVDEKEFGVSREALVRVLKAENVHARRYFFPGIHTMEPYASTQPNAAKHLPITCDVADRVICLPTGQTVSAAMIQQICNVIRIVHDNAQVLVKAVEQR